MIEDEDLDKLPAAPMNITSMLYSKQARYHFHKMPQVIAHEIAGDTQTFRWLNDILITVRRSFHRGAYGFKGGRVTLLKIENTATDQLLAHFVNGSMELIPTRGSLEEEIFKRVLLSYN